MIPPYSKSLLFIKRLNSSNAISLDPIETNIVLTKLELDINDGQIIEKENLRRTKL